MPPFFRSLYYLLKVKPIPIFTQSLSISIFYLKETIEFRRIFFSIWNKCFIWYFYEWINLCLGFI